MSVTIKPVTTKKEMKQFICFNYELYKDSPYAVPELFTDVRDTLDPKKNAAFEFCEAQPFIAIKDGKVVGRIVGIINHKANARWEKKVVRFGWVDFIDDAEVVDALFATVEQWGKERGMEEVNGPLGFTDFDPEGMLIEGFDRIGTMATIYNYPYYPIHMERMGYVKDTDWVEYLLTAPQFLPERHARIARIVKEKFGLHVVKYTSHRKLARERKENTAENMLAAVLLHVVKAATPVDLAAHFTACIQCAGAVVGDDTVLFVHIGDDDAAVQNTLIGGLTAALRIEGSLIKDDVKAVLAAFAGDDLGGEAGEIGVFGKKLSGFHGNDPLFS